MLSLAVLSFGSEIPIQTLDMNLNRGANFAIESILPGEISEVEVDHITLKGPFTYDEEISEIQDLIYLFLTGEGTFYSRDTKKQIEKESIAVATSATSVRIKVPRWETLHFIRIKKLLSEKDFQDIASFPPENRGELYFKTFLECEAYTEKIKSPNTVSRTILPKDHIPRVAMGTVQAPGPDAVGAHEHGMLEQLFLGLSNNQITVHADGINCDFGEYDILHIPRGSSHGVSVEDNNQMYYVWMDFFMTKEGQVWLKTHKSMDDK